MSESTGTTIRLTIAKATEADIEAVMKLMRLVDAIDDGYLPEGMAEDQGEFFDEDSVEHLRWFHREVMSTVNAEPSCLLRVTLGMHALLRSGLLDPQADHLAVNPELERDVARVNFLQKLVESAHVSFCPEAAGGASMRILRSDEAQTMHHRLRLRDTIDDAMTEAEAQKATPREEIRIADHEPNLATDEALQRLHPVQAASGEVGHG
jgi:hypothetical protein